MDGFNHVIVRREDSVILRSSLQDPSPCTADCQRICQRFVKSLSCRILMYSYQAGNAFARLVFASYRMRKLAAEHPAEQVGKEIRKLYSWNNEDDKLINN